MESVTKIDWLSSPSDTCTGCGRSKSLNKFPLCFKCDGERKEEAAFKRGFDKGHEKGLSEGIQEGMKRAPRPAAAAPIELTQLRRLIQLCHPDKHQNSEIAKVATQYLLAMKEGLQ